MDTQNDNGLRKKITISSWQQWVILGVALLIVLLIAYHQNTQKSSTQINQRYNKASVNSYDDHNIETSDFQDFVHRRDVSDFVDDHKVVQSLKRDKEEGTHRRDVSDFVDDHKVVQSVKRDKEEGTHRRDVSDFVDDHKVVQSVKRDKEEDTHDKEYSDWVDHDTDLSIEELKIKEEYAKSLRKDESDKHNLWTSFWKAINPFD